jgi:hypothetical protein
MGKTSLGCYLDKSLSKNHAVIRGGARRRDYRHHVTGFRAAYCKRPHHPQLKVRRRTETADNEVLARAWQAANGKARELGWIA